MKTHLGKLSIPAAALAASMALAIPSASAQQGRYGGNYGGHFGGNSVLMNCSSSDYDRRVCRTPGRVADARIVRKISSSGCRQGSDWGIYTDAIWVKNGCRADFEVYLGGRNARRDDGLAGGQARNRNRNRDRGWDYNGRQDVRFKRPNKRRAISACYDAMEHARGIQVRRALAVEYVNEPRLVETRKGYVLRGPVRITQPRGYTRVGTVCELQGNRVTNFYIDK